MKVTKSPFIKKTILFIAILMILIELIPYLITIIYTSLCYGCTNIGKFQQKLNGAIKLSYINWTIYFLLLLYCIKLSLSIKNKFLMIATISFILFLIYLPTYPLLNLVTLFLILLYKNPPFVYNYKEEFPASIYIEKKTDLIINEYKKYISTNDAECLRKSVPGFTIENVDSNKTNCWRAIHLKKYGKIDEEMKYHFPETVSVLSDKQIHNAFFSILDTSLEIPPHVGYYKGYLRYHLGIIIPNNDTGKLDDKAYIVCGDEKYIWKAGKGIVFDDMYMHYVKNPTDQTRVVLYLDIKRKSDNFFVNKINDIGIFLIESSLLINLFIKNQHGQNKIEEFNTNIKN